MASERLRFEFAIGVILMSMLIVGMAVAETSSDGNRLHGQKLAEAFCAGCHGVDGNGMGANPEYPKLAGQKSSYLRDQLRAFKSGARKSDIMAGPASAISNAQIVELAHFYNGQPVKPDSTKDPKLAELGARIFNQPMRSGPPCVACHNSRGFGPMGPMGGRVGMMQGRGMMREMGPMGMMGNFGDVPNLNGQHAAYVVQQLNAFASGVRQATVMGPIAAALSERDRKAVAEYLSGLQ
jgi:cytochrome c553